MKKNKLIVLQIVIIFMLICSSVYAATSTIDITVSKSTVKKGDTVTVTLSLKDIDSSEKITTIQGYINYDTDIIEKITGDNFVKNSDGKIVIGNRELPFEEVKEGSGLPATDEYILFNPNPDPERAGKNKNFILIDLESSHAISSDVELFKIKFKVKSDASIGEVEDAISFSKFLLNENEEHEISKNIKLVVENGTAEPSKNEANNENTNKNTNVDNTNKNTNVNNTNVDNTNKNTNVNNTNVDNTNKNTNVNNTNTNTNKNTNVNNTNTNTNKNTNVNNTNKNNGGAVAGTNKDESVAGTKIPAAGAKMIIIPTMLLIVLAYISYNKYMNMKDI